MSSSVLSESLTTHCAWLDVFISYLNLRCRLTPVGCGLNGLYPSGSDSAAAFPYSRPHTNEENEMIKGFRDFIMRGNVIDLAVAVIIDRKRTAGTFTNPRSS
jgi:hypothetical protein